MKKRRSELSIFSIFFLLFSCFMLAVISSDELEGMARLLNLTAPQFVRILVSILVFTTVLFIYALIYTLVHSSKEAPILDSCPALQVNRPERDWIKSAERICSALGREGLKCEVIKKGAAVGKVIDSLGRISIPDHHVNIHFISDLFSSKTFWLVVVPEPFPKDANWKMDDRLLDILDAIHIP